MKILINFYASILDTTVNDLIRVITQISADHSQKDTPIQEIVIQISSSGGSSDHGLLAYNFLKQLGIKVTTIGMGNVDSAAIMLFAAGSTRISAPSCRFLIHEAMATIQGQFNANKLGELKNITERINEDYCNVIAKVCLKNIEEIKNIIKDSSVMSSSQAKDFGLVQQISEEPYIQDLKGIPIVGINNPKIIQPIQRAEI